MSEFTDPKEQHVIKSCFSILWEQRVEPGEMSYHLGHHGNKWCCLGPFLHLSPMTNANHAATSCPQKTESSFLGLSVYMTVWSVTICESSCPFSGVDWEVDGLSSKKKSISVLSGSQTRLLKTHRKTLVIKTVNISLIFTCSEYNVTLAGGDGST